MISAGLKSSAVADGLFDFYQLNHSGIEEKVFTLHGQNGAVTSVTVWMLNNKDPNLQRYETTMQYTMSFEHIEQVWVPTGTSVTIPSVELHVASGRGRPSSRPLPCVVPAAPISGPPEARCL